jgi:putative endonuclease
MTTWRVIPSEVPEGHEVEESKMKDYYVYVMSSHSGVLYIGVTSDLIKRVYEHKNGLVEGFTKKYKTKKLVYYESTKDVLSAIEREKQLKKWRRDKKDALIEKMNPARRDLYDDLV